jgi:hypothetical protein
MKPPFVFEKYWAACNGKIQCHKDRWACILSNGGHFKLVLPSSSI